MCTNGLHLQDHRLDFYVFCHCYVEDKTSDCSTILAAPFVPLLYETTVVFCYTAPPPNIDLNRRNWRENSGFLLAEIRLGFSPLPLYFLVTAVSGSRGMSPFLFLRAAAVLELWLVKIFRLCGEILLNETWLTTQEARWLFAVCLGVAKSLYFNITSSHTWFFCGSLLMDISQKLTILKIACDLTALGRLPKKGGDMWVGFFRSEFCFGWSSAGRLWLQGLAPPDRWLCCESQLQDADGFISTFTGFSVLGINYEMTRAVSDKLKIVSFL